MNEILLKQNKDGTWEEYDPFCEIVCETEEDFNCIKEAVKLYDRIKNPKTNADRIRAMSDEELADALFDLEGKDLVTIWCNSEKAGCDIDDCEFECNDKMLKSCILRWLGAEEVI